MKGIASLLLLLALVPSALAVDTWEPYPMGPSAIEFYFTRFGIGQELGQDRGKSLIIGPSWGIHESSHIYLFTGITYPDRDTGGLDLFSIGIFKNFYGGFDSPVKIDAYYDISAVEEGLRWTTARAGLEINYDADRIGLYARPARNWQHAYTPNDYFTADLGAWIDIAGFAQFFIEGGYQEVNVADGKEFDFVNLALGLNVLTSKEMELILELSIPDIPESEKRIYDITLGAVTVW